MTTPSNTRTLGEVAAHPAIAPAAVAIAGDPGMDAVVLALVDATTVEVFAGGSVRTYPDTTPVTPITDPDRRLRLAVDALVGLDQQRRQLTAETISERDGHAATLADIRGYAIKQHLDGGYYSLDQLNEFLHTFDLPEYHPRLRITYTITGSYEVNGADTYAADRDARRLRVDLSTISGLVAGTDNHVVDVNPVDLLDRGPAPQPTEGAHL